MEFVLGKMKSEIKASELSYFLKKSDGSGLFLLNDLIGKSIKLSFKEKKNCISCGTAFKKSFHNGYCYPCFQSLAECDICIMKPELCHFSKGTCRDESFAKRNCFIPHVVYLADSSSLKVGITRAHQKTTRWVDQGANQAVAIWQVETRKEAGEVEVFLKDYIGDKTNWRNMLKGLRAEEDIEFKRDDLLEICESADLPGEALYDEEIFEINYPVEAYPDKITSFNLEKLDSFEGVLKGIKGQYLILDTGVFNVRKHSGYLVDISY